MPTDTDHGELEFISAVPAHMRHEVEHLFFFNPRQGLLIEKIREAVERYGLPEIHERDGRIQIGLRHRAVQCLFVCDRTQVPAQLAGIALFLRTQHDCLSIIHIAVEEAYVQHADRAGSNLGAALVREVQRIAHQINGVTRVELPYQPGRFLPV